MRRLMTLARVAETFHVLPSQAARALDEDAEQLDLLCLDLLSYASIKEAFDRAGNDDKSLENIKDHPHMLAVRRNSFDLFKERRDAEAARNAGRMGPKHTDSRRETQKQQPDTDDVTPKPLTRQRRFANGG